MEREARVLAKFASFLASLDESLDPTTRLCESVRLTLGADDVAVTLRPGRTYSTVLASTGRVSETYEHLQQLAGEGPSRDAARLGTPVFVPVSHEGLDAWSTLSTVAERSQIEGNFWSVPMRPADLVIGVLTLHREAGELDEPISVVQFVANAVGTVLLGHTESEAGRRSTLSGVWSSRAEVHQATGMVTAQLHISPADAMALLQAHSYAQDRHLHEVAQDVVAGTIDFTEDTGQHE